jgi:hypothetical protein
MTPIFKTVRRTWRDRLFSLPWRPLKSHALVRDHEAEARAAVQAAAVSWPAIPRKSSARRASGISVVPTHTYVHATSPSPTPSPSGDSFLMTASMLGLMSDTREHECSSRRDDFASGGGGDFGGGGASGSWEAPAPPPSYSSGDSYSSSCDSGSSGSYDSGSSSSCSSAD